MAVKAARFGERSTREDAMSEAQATLLRALSLEAFEPEAFRLTLSKAEAALRIAALRAKLQLQDEPPHTL